METKIQYWGYLHINNTLHVKRFFDYTDISEALASPFVKRTAGPFFADNIDNALQILKTEI